MNKCQPFKKCAKKLEDIIITGDDKLNKDNIT